MNSDDEMGEIEDLPKMGNVGTNEGEAMDAVVAKNKDEVEGDIGENDEVGKFDFEEENEELEALTGSPLLQEFKSGLK